MNFRRCSIFVLVLSGLLVCAAAQDPPAQNPPAQSTTSDEPRSTPAPAMSGIIGIDSPVLEEDTSGNLPQIPAILGGQGPSLAFRAEQERSNYLRGGVNVGFSYDDNTLLSSSGAISNTSYTVFPNIAIDQTSSRMSWNLGYAAGITVNQRVSNHGSHDLAFDSQFRVSPHVSLRVAENFAIRTGFFDSGNSNPAGNGGPNANLITPLAKERSSSTVAEADYHFALRDVAGVSGSFYDLQYSDVPAGEILTDTRTATAAAFWLHRFGRNWIGTSYRFQHLTFDLGNGVTDVHSFLVVDTITLPARLSVAGFAGPEYSDNRGLVAGGDAPLHFTDWSPAFGAEASWQKDHTSAAVGFSRRLNDGGGVLGVVRQQSVHGNLRQELFPGWALGLSASYGNNTSLTVPVAVSASSIDTTTVGASLERNLGKNLGLHIGYEHDFQDQSGTTNPAFLGGAHRNRFFVTLGYQWARPLGR